MPLYGTLDITQDPRRLPTVANLDTEAWSLPKAEMMQLLIEVPRSSTDGLLPKAMHPALPSYVIAAFTRYPESPVGAFNLAVLRLGSRAGAHPRGFLLGALASTEAAAKELRSRWGFPGEHGEVKFTRRHDRVMGTAKKDGKTVLECALVDPQPVAGSDVQYINWVTAANAPLDGQTAPLLIQVDPKYTFYKAERGKPQVSAFDAAAWNAGGITLADPIVGTCCTVDTDLPRIRFVMDPLKPVFQGTRRIRESRVEE
ncbi:MAG: acetoacetate decarboxylase family protein [Alphaproteobacteria bacterium]|nr:acetoacetate decarboxylase family protein [Alphaproteobacteria bacterium]MCW5742486.1 acetoacetate decarboxylase family protein [Alphaproteobacteria bacterium]